MFEEAPVYPQVGDTLIKQGNSTKALFADWMTGQWDFYANGYKRAGDILVDQLEGGTQDDPLILPILFSYRHYTELKLKTMIIGFDKLTGQRMKDEKFGHNLEHLWSYLKNQLLSLPDKPMEKGVIPALDSLIREFIALDRGSYTFRYAQDKLRENEMPLPHQVDMPHLKETMEKIKNGLDYLEAGIDVEYERRDFEAEMSAEMQMYIDY